MSHEMDGLGSIVCVCKGYGFMTYGVLIELFRMFKFICGMDGYDIRNMASGHMYQY